MLDYNCICTTCVCTDEVPTERKRIDVDIVLLERNFESKLLNEREEQFNGGVV
jgi:hypothetical protein